MKGNAGAMKFLEHYQWRKTHQALATTIDIIEEKEIQQKRKEKA